MESPLKSHLIFGHDGNYKDQMNYKIHDVTTWSTNNYSTYIP